MQELLKKLKSDLDSITSWYKTEISTLRTGRATPALVEDIDVDMYGAKTPLKHIASISTPDAKSILISPWDKGAIQPIQAALEASSLNMRPVADKDSIRLSLPPLTEERRKDLIKLLGSKSEEARVKSRHSRDEAMKGIQDLEKAKQISEDQRFRAKDELQKQIDGFNSVLEAVRADKEREILEK
jgi:ribosome recycling factor